MDRLGFQRYSFSDMSFHMLSTIMSIEWRTLAVRTFMKATGKSMLEHRKVL